LPDFGEQKYNFFQYQTSQVKKMHIFAFKMNKYA